MLGVRIAALRKAAGMNQAQLAERLLISTSAVGMYEQGRREPSLETLADIARVFGVSMDFLVTGKAVTEAEKKKLDDLVVDRINASDRRLQSRKERPFSRQELAVLFASMLIEP